MKLREFDYAVSFKTDPEELRRENATLRARLRAKEEECNRWALRWAREGLTASEAVRLTDPLAAAFDDAGHPDAAAPLHGRERDANG